MRERIALALVLTGLLACAIGCKKQVDKAEFISAINQTFAGRHECVWPEPIKLPVEADPSKDEKIRGYDAVTDAGLFIRESVEKKRSINTTSPIRATPLGLPIPASPAPVTSASATSTPPRSTTPPPMTHPTPRNTPSITVTKLKESPTGSVPPNR